MSRIKHLLLIAFLFISGSAHAINNYQDWWWNPAQSGMGLNVGQQNDTIFVAWFNYGDDTKASFLTMGGVLNGNTLTGTLYRGSGPVPGPNYNPAQVKQTAVGTATLTFNSNNDATLTYSYDNKGGTMALQRFSFASPNLMQTFLVMDNYFGCDSTSPGQSEMRYLTGKEQIGNKLTLANPKLDGSDLCTLTMTSQSAGSKLNAQGTANCSGDPETYNFAIEDLLIQSDFITYNYTASKKQGGTLICILKGKVAGVVQKAPMQSFDLSAALHNRILKGSSKTFNVSGHCNGTYTMTDSPATQTTWKGQSFYAVSSIQIANLPNCSLSISNQSFITYYDMNFLEVFRTRSNGNYSEFVSTPLPTTLKIGDTGTLGTWFNWYDASKSRNWGSNVRNYIVEPGTANYVVLNVIDRNYSDQSQLISTTQIRYQLTDTGNLEMISVTSDFTNNNEHLVFQ